MKKPSGFHKDIEGNWVCKACGKTLNEGCRCYINWKNVVKKKTKDSSRNPTGSEGYDSGMRD